jgi:hypothetical protein
MLQRVLPWCCDNSAPTSRTAKAGSTSSSRASRWHVSSAHLEDLARSVLTSAPITSLRFSLDGTRLQVLFADNTEHILDATTLQPAAGDRQVAPTISPAWAEPRDTSPDNAWRAESRKGRLEIVPAAKRG